MLVYELCESFCRCSSACGGSPCFPRGKLERVTQMFIRCRARATVPTEETFAETNGQGLQRYQGNSAEKMP